MGVCNVFKIYCLLFDKQLGGNIYVIHISSIPKLSDNKLQFQVTWKYCISFAFSEGPELNQIALVCGSLFFSSLVLYLIPAHTTLPTQMFEL